MFTSWRTGGAWGFRIGLAEDARDDLAVFGGADLSGSLLRVSDEMPVDLVWVAGGGFGIGEHSILSFPLGLSAGRTLLADAVALTPWLGPRVILDAWLGDDPPRDALDLGLAVDVGLDVAFESGWTVRFAGSFGDREALAIGINFLVF